MRIGSAASSGHRHGAEGAHAAAKGDRSGSVPPAGRPDCVSCDRAARPAPERPHRGAPKDSGGQEDAQVFATAIHVGEHRAQTAGEADPAPPAEHAGVGAQGVPEEP